MPVFAEWDSFYIIVGPAAGALIGLQFVVMTLIAGNPPVRTAEAGPAFATPTIVHFSVVLLLSALLRAPWQTITPPAWLCGFVGLGGLIYAAIVARRMHRQKAYRPDFEDWLFFAALPLAGYALLMLFSFMAFSHARESLFGIGGAALLLLFTGIHNSWDSIAFQVFVVPLKKDRRPDPGEKE